MAFSFFFSRGIAYNFVNIVICFFVNTLSDVLNIRKRCRFDTAENEPAKKSKNLQYFTKRCHSQASSKGDLRRRHSRSWRARDPASLLSFCRVRYASASAMPSARVGTTCPRSTLGPSLGDVANSGERSPLHRMERSRKEGRHYETPGRVLETLHALLVLFPGASIH